MSGPISSKAFFAGFCLLFISSALSLAGFCGHFAFAAEDPSVPGRVSYDELIKTRAAHLFQSEDYEPALEEFRKLSLDYPEDGLPKRYVGMTLTLLGRLDEAAGVLEELVQSDPVNPSYHYYLARVYHEQGDQDSARQELHEVIRLDPKGYYGNPAEEVLERTEREGSAQRPWNLWASVGYEYDTNVTLAPTDKALRGTADQSAGRYALAAGGTYRYLEDAQWEGAAGYEFYQSLHDDSLNEFNYSAHTFSHYLQRRFQKFAREGVGGIRVALPFGFLNGNIFTFSAELTAYVNSRFTKNTFTEIYHRYSHTEFGPDGALPRVSSRDGEYNASGIHHRFYFSDYRRYVFAGYEFQTAATAGDSFDRVGHFMQVGFHSPLFSDQLSYDVMGSFTAAHYPHYSTEIAPAEQIGRLDHNGSLLARLNYKLSRHWTLQTFYRLDNANNQNDVFQYDRHIVGGQLTVRV